MKPILFNTEMTKALLEGRKTVTRRIAKKLIAFDEEKELFNLCKNNGEWIGATSKETIIKGYAPYKVGNILYVKETFTKVAPLSEDGTLDFDNTEIYYYANDEDREVVNNINYVDADGFSLDRPFPWKPSIHMPKELARIFLKVTDVRVERLQEITIEDVEKEGYPHEVDFSNMPVAMKGIMFEWWANLWNSTVKKQDLDKYELESNPFVWVIEFERVEVE